MNKRIDLLDKLKKLQDDIECRKFVETLCIYYEINDIDIGTQHGKIFRTLYLTSNNISYDEIAYRFNINVYTLDRYRQKYNDLARKLLSMDSSVFVNLTNTVGLNLT